MLFLAPTLTLCITSRLSHLLLHAQLLAPTDDAFDALLTNLGGGQGKLPLDALLRLPTLKDILLYHIVPGRYTSGAFACDWCRMQSCCQWCHVPCGMRAPPVCAHACKQHSHVRTR